VYFFLVSYLAMVAYGAVRALIEGPGSFTMTAPPAIQPVSILLVSHAFAAGCTALTGIEAISNGVPAFKPPEWRNARRTLAVMALLMGILFLGSIGLTQYFAVVAGPQETILSALARRILGSGMPYVIVQTATLLILAVAANTSFAGFPRLMSVLARDGYVPRQLSNLGDRLVFSNGMILLAVLAGGLIVLFRGDTHALIPLFAVGVFLAFTLSQAGMVVHWVRERGQGWGWKAFVNGLGTVATATAFLIVGISKFAAGAWIVLLLIPLLAAAFGAVKRHYAEVSRELSLSGLPPSLKPMPSPRVVVPVSGVHRGVVESVRFARSITDRVTAVYVEITPGAAERVRAEWEKWGQGVPLVVVPSPYRSIIGPLLEFLDKTDREHNDGQLATIIMPQFVPARWWQNVLHNQTAWLLRLALLYRRRRFGHIRAVVDIPFYLKR
jgi:hypothetical protein